MNDPIDKFLTMPVLMSILGISAMTFSVGSYIGTLSCAHSLDVLRAEFNLHRAMPIHPGAATSEIVKDLTERVRQLELNERGQRP